MAVIIFKIWVSRKH